MSNDCPHKVTYEVEEVCDNCVYVYVHCSKCHKLITTKKRNK